MNNSIDIKQKKLLKYIKPQMHQRGQSYKKITNIFARPAIVGEVVTTITSSGKETTKEGRPGDILVKNQTEAEEVYLISREKFKQKYDYLQPAGEGFSEYTSKGKIFALEITESMLTDFNLPDSFHYEAPWGSAAFAQKGDFWVMPMDYSEVYRIDRSEFFQTYQLVHNLAE